MKTIKRLFISLIVLLGCSAGTWAIEQDSEGYYLIGSVQDWKDFAAIVETTNDANAKMFADVDLGDDQTHIGSMTQDGTTFKGTFDGQGYTLTVAYVGGRGQIVAPFTNVQGATIKNLHVDGSISSVFAFIGVVGYVRGRGYTTTVSNVWNSATMNIQTGEWAQSSAIVGGFNNGNVAITDCLYTGSFTTNQGGYCGCFVGYNYAAGSITQTNCLSTGTFNMSGTGFRGTHTNCYVSSFPASFPSGVNEATAEGLSDGTIATALGDAWAQDAATGQPMLKIFTTMRQDEDGYYLIGSVTDWRRFAAIVGTTPTANGKMIRDVDLGDDQTTIGHPNENPSYHFKGIFDGQGHTLTVHYVKQGEKDICSPFPNISEATIKNIHIDGTIESSTACQPAAIGCVRYGTSTIENVWSSVELTSTKVAWCEASGLVGCVDGYKGGHLIMTNCMVSGNIKSSGSYEGCFIGYINGGGSANVSNCLSVANYDYSGTSGFMGNYTNCYVKQFPSTIPSEMRITDQQLSDGTIAEALGDAWVQDEIINMPMLKIFANPAIEYFLIGSLQDWKDFAELVETVPTTNGKLIADVDLGDDQTMVGSIASPYQGLFDGQGYTLTVNYDMSLTTSAVAPFTVVGNATIQKLHVDGSIKQQYCAAGGVVGSIMGNVTIKECWVSAYMYVQGSGNLQGTIGGIASCCDNSNARDCSILIEDCVFSGEMATGYHCGSIMSHVNGDYGNSATIKNCLSIGTYASAIGSTGTFIRTGVQGDPYTIENCYYETPWGAVQGTQATAEELADGTTAASLGNAWMQDPNKNLPLPKIFVKPNAEALDGLFTINASGEEVVFAQGNLQKLGNMYQFAKNQYDYFGTDQSDTHRDMFAFLDYNNPAVDEPWSMLSHDEWKYLLITRSVTNTLSADARFTMATIGDTYKGLIIFPDYYEHPEGTGFIAGVFNSNSNYTAQVSLEGWAMMEAAGCVFLPAAGYCSRGETWKGVGEHICYMSTTAAGSGYYTPWITPEGVYLGSESISVNSTWSSIRLVLRKEPITYTVPTSGLGTFSSTDNILLPEGLNAHYCKTYIAERSAIKVLNISGNVVPANTGVLLSGTPGETFTLTATNRVADNMVDNELVAVTESKHINAVDGDYTNFIMKGGKFEKVLEEDESVMMPAHRAYLPLLTSEVANAKFVGIIWDDDTVTGLDGVPTDDNRENRYGDGTIYNLQGQKVDNPTRGIYIINGMKVVIK